jgi:hypothetical protein
MNAFCQPPAEQQQQAERQKLPAVLLDHILGGHVFRHARDEEAVNADADADQTDDLTGNVVLPEARSAQPKIVHAEVVDADDQHGDSGPGNSQILRPSSRGQFLGSELRERFFRT